MSAIENLQKHLEQQKEIPFVEFMHYALYAPGDGYYSSGLQKLGKYGDFITAPELTPLFGTTLAKQLQQILPQLANPSVFEFGAGSGALCVDILRYLESVDCLPQSYLILELSANLRHRQVEHIQTQLHHLAHRVQWLDRWPESPFNGVVIANEVLDAMPVHRFLQKEQEVYESYISLNEDQQLIEQFKPCQNKRLLNYVQSRLPRQETPYVSEANLYIDEWVAALYQMLGQGLVLLIDYGFPRHEYYHPDRNQGTLMCHYQHRTHSNPLIHVGEQDITAHVDFTHVAEAGQNAGFHVAGYTNQASFLLANDLLSLLDLIDNERDLINAKQAIKQLTHPSEMGELFKVIALNKQMDSVLTGFLLNDKRVSL
jgi:SAM-dependent MidA family methyltransferase